MLLRFSVSNYRSFYDQEVFSMEAGKTRNFTDRTARIGNTKLLKFKAIYGANSSGKSSLVKAIDFMQVAVTEGIPSESVSDYCRLYEENINAPSSFEIQVALDGVVYTYGFDILLSESRFLTEWLYERKSQKDRLVFSRNIGDEQYNVSSYVSGAALNDRLSIYADDIKSDGSVLFLKVMNQNKDSLYADNSKINVYRSLFRWFRYGLSVNHPEEPITQYTYFFDSHGSEMAEQILSEFDTGIAKVRITDEPAEKVMSLLPKPFAQDVIDNLNEQKSYRQKEGIEGNPAAVIRTHEGHSMYLIELNGDNIVCKTLKFNHRHSNALFSLRDESDGTVRLLDLIEVLLSTASNMVYVIDEVNRCLHPLVTKQFVKSFLDLAVERNIQLIVTTHETGLMDLGFLRQDEIGFVEKRSTDGTTRIFSLEDYGARFDKRIRNAYMKGQYDAVPNVEAIRYE